MLCVVCNDDIFEGENLRCKICKEHLHFSCASMRETNFRKMNKQSKEKWSCVKCKITTAVDCNTSNTQDDVSFVGSNDKLSSLTDSVKFMSNQFDVFGKQLNEVLNSIKELREENKTLKEKNSKLCDDVCKLNRKINVLEQKSIINNVELIGVPEEQNENCKEVVELIASKIGVKIEVVNAFRTNLKSSNKPSKMIAILSSMENKQNLMEAAKKKKLNAIMVNEKWENRSIFINNELSSYNRELFYKTRMFAKANEFKFVWFKDLKVFIKKNENYKACIIQDDHDLSKLLCN